jgi:chromate transporter
MVAGPWGAPVCTVAIFGPSFLMVVGVTPYFDRLRRSRFFNAAVAGILPSFIGLLFAATVAFARDIPWEPRRLVIAAAAFAALLLRVKLPWVVLAGTAASVLLL